MAGAYTRVPIDITQPEGGYVEFRGDISAPAGIYSFSYYFRKAVTKPKTYIREKNIDFHAHPWNIYITGLELYTRLVRLDAPAPGWKVVIYTDQQTLDDIDESMPSPEKEKIKAVFADPNVILAKVVWPEYSPFPAIAPQTILERKVENAILRTFRMFSFTVFNCPVFVRDADTTFEVGVGTFEEVLDLIRVWETTFLEQAIAKGFPLIYASQLGYARKFHIDYRIENESAQSLGTFAGMVNYLGGIPEMRELWQESLAYIRGTCHIIPETGISSNQYKVERYISKDEQILLFVILPALMDRTFFFYYKFTPDTDISSWSDLKSGFGRAFNRFVETFPEQFQEEVFGTNKQWTIIDSRFFLSPDEKLKDFLIKTQFKYIFNLAPNGTEPTVNKFTEQWMKEWIEKGLTDSDDPISDLRWVREHRGDFLHNSYSVIEAFRNPKYDAFLRITFEELQREHRKVCIAKGVPGRFVLSAKYNEANRRNLEIGAPVTNTVPHKGGRKKTRRSKSKKSKKTRRR